ncbi:hypothetical protein [Pseudomonas sp. RIT-PI-S]|uniref:hypothetical protein n=1 Tax=Pseudomonas sp. RIT-PI-S TaxID=3035295 RepID=UPI0021D8A036|nr:hypothetical protein [Pseudomonas sp. RIT-PI-S]
MLTRHALPLLLTAFIAPLMAAPAPPGMTERVRGTIDAVAVDSLSIHDRDGRTLSLLLTDKTRINSVATGSPADIGPDSYIGTAARLQPDGTLRALEVHVFAASLRGAGEGHRPWAAADGSEATMTNGTVGTVKASDGQRLTVRYGDGEKTVWVPDGVPIVRLEPGNRSQLLPGAAVVVSAAPDEQGRPVAQSVSVGVGGVVPPM